MFVPKGMYISFPVPYRKTIWAPAFYAEPFMKVLAMMLSGILLMCTGVGRKKIVEIKNKFLIFPHM